MSHYTFTGTVEYNRTHIFDGSADTIIQMILDDGSRVIWETSRRIARAMRHGHRYRIHAHQTRTYTLEDQDVTTVEQVSVIEWLASRRYA